MEWWGLLSMHSIQIQKCSYLGAYPSIRAKSEIKQIQALDDTRPVDSDNTRYHTRMVR